MIIKNWAALCAFGLIAIMDFSSANQAPVCKTEAECKAKALEIHTTAEAAKLGDIVKTPDGKAIQMNHYEAEKYCKAQGSRLPTAREFAREAQRLGAKGIEETKYPNFSADSNEVQVEEYQMIKGGYETNYAKTPVGMIVVDFYFKREGYQRPSGDLGNHAFWTSTIGALDHRYAYGLNGIYGFFDIFDRRSPINFNGDHALYGFSAVRCIVH